MQIKTILKLLIIILITSLNQSFASLVTGGDNLIAEYKFSVCDINSTVKDSSGNNLHGILDNNAQIALQEGVINDGLRLNFPDNEETLNKASQMVVPDDPDNPKLQLTQDLTISLWIKSKEYRNAGLVVKNHDHEFWFALRSNGKLGFKHGSDANHIVDTNSTQALVNNIWYHVAVVRDNTQKTISFYINGKLDSTHTYTIEPSISNSHLTIGVCNPCHYSFKGDMDEIKIFATAFNATNIEKIYNNEKSKLNYDGNEIQNKINIKGAVKADNDFDGNVDIDGDKDAPLQNVKIDLLDANNHIIKSVYSDKNGNYEFHFPCLKAGQYFLQENNPKGYVDLNDKDGINDNEIEIDIQNNQNIQDFIDNDFYDQKRFVIEGNVRIDLNGDGVVDAGQPNAHLQLQDQNGVVLVDENGNNIEVDADENGHYIFENIIPGEYIVAEIDPDGVKSIKDKDGKNDNIIHVVVDNEDVKGQDFENSLVGQASPLSTVVISKSSSKKEVHIGDFVPYTIEIKNTNSLYPYMALTIKDTIPNGFYYVKDSAQLIYNNTKTEKITASGNTIVYFGTFKLGANEHVKLTYLLKVGAETKNGRHTNIAIATQNDREISNLSSATVQVVSDAFLDNALVIGKVFEDINKNGIQDSDERGIAGVRLATATGMLIETDAFGRYHIADIDSGGLMSRGKNIIIKIDTATLPKDSNITTENPRVYRVTSGALNVVNFGVSIPKTGQFSKDKEFVKITTDSEMVPVYKKLKIGSIFFDSDQNCIRPDQVKKLKQIAKKLQTFNTGTIIIEGNTDARAPIWYNKKLAYKRASSVYCELENILGKNNMNKIDIIYNNCNKEVKFNPKYDWWGKPNAPKTKKECTQLGKKVDCRLKTARIPRRGER